MATPYDVICDRFLSKIKEYDFIEFEDDEVKQMFDMYLNNAIPKFRYCRKNLTDRNSEERVFNETLSDSEQDILSSLCVLEWLGMQVNDSNNFKKFLSTKDFYLHSPANQLKEIRAAKEELYYTVYTQINFYRFDEKSSEV